MFPLTIFVIVPNKGYPIPQIFGMELNSVDKCPLCGKRLETVDSVGLVSGGSTTNAMNYPWHTTIYHIKAKSFQYKCGGTIIQSNAGVVITAGKVILKTLLQFLNQLIS